MKRTCPFQKQEVPLVSSAVEKINEDISKLEVMLERVKRLKKQTEQREKEQMEKCRPLLQVIVNSWKRKTFMKREGCSPQPAIYKDFSKWEREETQDIPVWGEETITPSTGWCSMKDCPKETYFMLFGRYSWIKNHSVIDSNEDLRCMCYGNSVPPFKIGATASFLDYDDYEFHTTKNRSNVNGEWQYIGWFQRDCKGKQCGDIPLIVGEVKIIREL